MKNFAVILCGSGYKDGSEIRESVAVLWALSTFQANFECFAPDKLQFDVVNCLTEEPTAEKRNQLVESARIARGKVKSLTHLSPKSYAGLLMPGGFGAAKNLCNFASRGADGEVIPEAKAAIIGFWELKKPIGAVCIAPAVVGLALKGKRLELSVGKKCATSDAIEKMGHRHVETPVNSCHVDLKNKIVTSPAYMYDEPSLADLFEGVRKLVGAVIELVTPNAFHREPKP